MRNLFIIVLSFLLLSFMNNEALGQTKPLNPGEEVSSRNTEEGKDVKGWSKTHWGMTNDEILDLFKGQALQVKKEIRHNDQTYSTIRINNFDINGTDFEVLFYMGIKDDKLQKVLLRHKNAIESMFGSFEQLLTEKFGPPSHTDFSRSQVSRRDFKRDATWIFPSTKIELIFMTMYPVANYLVIWYSDQSYKKETLEKF